MPRNLTKKALYSALTVVALIISTTLLNAAHHNPRIAISNGGHIFHTLYKLHARSPDVFPSDLIVEMTAGRTTRLAPGCHEITAVPGWFSSSLAFTLHGTQASVETELLKNGHQKITNTNIDPSSPWYPGLKKLLKIATLYDATKKKPYAKKFTPKTTPHFQITRLPGATLHSMYALINQSHPRSGHPCARSILLHVITKYETVKEHQNKKMITVLATFHTRKTMKHSNVPVEITFAKTKNGLRCIFKKNIKRSSVWYRSIKKIAYESVSQYNRFIRIGK